jgi:hypothetical protein
MNPTMMSAFERCLLDEDLGFRAAVLYLSEAPTDDVLSAEEVLQAVAWSIGKYGRPACVLHAQGMLSTAMLSSFARMRWATELACTTT